MRKKTLGAILFGSMLLGAFYMNAQAATFTVTSHADSGPNTLRDAITQANGTPETDIIVLAVSNSITVHSELVVNQPVVLEGQGATLGATGNSILRLASGSDASVIRDIAIIDGYGGIIIYSNNNQILGCAIGTDWSDATGKGSDFYGLQVYGNSNIVGGPDSSSRNIISGNNGGIWLSGIGNTVQGNYIGLASDGLTILGNVNHGIYSRGSFQCLIGGDQTQGEGNIISGNSSGITSYDTITEYPGQSPGDHP